MQKGYSKDWKKIMGKIKLERYQSSKCILTYDEYLKLRN